MLKLSKNGWHGVDERLPFGRKKIYFVQKTPRIGIFERTKISITSLWEDLEAKLLTPGNVLGHPWKPWGITAQTSYVKGRWQFFFENFGCKVFLKAIFFSQNKGQVWLSVAPRLSSPLCHTVRKWWITRCYLLYTIPIQKIEQIASKWPVFWAIFGDFWGREPGLYGKLCDFRNLSVF